MAIRSSSKLYYNTAGSVVLAPLIVLKRDPLILEESVSFKAFCSAMHLYRRGAMFTLIPNKALFQIVVHRLLRVLR
jgi:hypothetical protein